MQLVLGSDPINCVPQLGAFIKASAMARKLLTVAEWQERIAQHFSDGDIVGGTLLELFDNEEKEGMLFYKKFIGHRYLSDAFQGFALNTLKALSPSHVNEVSKRRATFPLEFLDYLMIFRLIRASHVLSVNGYLGPGFALLREVNDKAMHLSAVFQNMVTYEELQGISPSEPEKATAEERNNLRRKFRRKIEREIDELFAGEKSGLLVDDLDQMDIRAMLFDREVHGSFVSGSTTADNWLRGQRKRFLIDASNETLAAAFMNRFNEVSWMYLRLLPLLQDGESSFGEEWESKWEILDESFWQMQIGLAQLGKPIGEAFIRFIDLKFPFTQKSRMV